MLQEQACKLEGAQESGLTYKLIYWAIWPSQGWSALAKYAATCGVPELPFTIDLWR